MNIDRIDKLKAFHKWFKYILYLRKIPQKIEMRNIAKILAKIHKNKMARRFMYWKYICKLDDEYYPMLSEHIDDGIIKT